MCFILAFGNTCKRWGPGPLLLSEALYHFHSASWTDSSLDKYNSLAWNPSSEKNMSSSCSFQLSSGPALGTDKIRIASGSRAGEQERGKATGTRSDFSRHVLKEATLPHWGMDGLSHWAAPTFGHLDVGKAALTAEVYAGSGEGRGKGLGAGCAPWYPFPWG